MAVSAYDVHICLCKILKLSWKACVTISTKHPLVSFSLFCLFIVYISFPSVFWFLTYSFPLVVSTCFILSISFTVGNDEKYRDDERGRGEESSDGNSISASGDSDKNRKKSYTRVHSVRRRRAKELKRDDDGNNSKIEEKIAVTSINFGFYKNVVDKKPLIEEIPKEIREVEVDDHSLFETTKTSSSLAPCQNPKQEFKDEKSTIKEVKDVESEEDDDDQKNVVDIGISEPERNKRLESLIARRRSRKLLSLQVRRTLINMDKNDRPGNISSIVIPKSNMNSCLSSNASGPFSPGPGSAPSVLVPMRNPFDLPYDPMEEKPDLTGDSFQQEFMPPNNNRDMMFCRHESFTLGAFFPGEFNQNRDYLVHDFGFRQKGSFQGYPFSNPRNSFDREFSPIMDQESYEENKSKSTMDIPDDDHIKEVIQVYENDVHNHSEEEQEDTTIEVETKPTPQENSSTSTSSPSSSEENLPVFKIDKEAILKSLSSMARRNVAQEEVTESNEQIGDSLSYGVSPFDTSSSRNKLKEQFYYSDKIVRRHAPSYSIASDLQVEVSEVSSPPLTIDENYSYQDHDDISSYDGDMEKKICWDDEDLWAGSSRLSHTDDNESRSTEVNEISDRDVLMKAGFSRINRLEDTTLSKSMEEPWNGKQYCISSSSSNADFHDRDQDHGMNMHEKIHEMFEYSSSNLHDNKRKKRWDLVPHLLDGNDSGKSMESCNLKRDLGESSYSIIGSSSEDSEERTEPQSEETNSDINIRPTERSENEQSSGEGSINLTALGSNDPQPLPLAPIVGFEHVPTSLISPTSVLVPRLSLDQGSLSSFDHDIEDEANNAQVLSPIALQSLEASVQESSESSMTSSTTEVDDTEFVDKHNILENIVEQKEVACGSSHELHSREAHVERIEESNHSSFDNNHDISNKETEAAKSNSSLYAEEELSNHQEMVNGEATHHFSDKSTSYSVDHREENSDLHGDTGPENCSNKHVGHERKTNSTSSNYIYGTKDQLHNLDADETHHPVSRLVENNDNSESCMKNEHDKRTKKHNDSLESMPVAEDKLN